MDKNIVFILKLVAYLCLYSFKVGFSNTYSPCKCNYCK